MPANGRWDLIRRLKVKGLNPQNQSPFPVSTVGMGPKPHSEVNDTVRKPSIREPSTNLEACSAKEEEKEVSTIPYTIPIVLM